jgi:TetR/AcrR family transcriptional regulator, mexJK operon transcriptional repressor
MNNQPSIKPLGRPRDLAKVEAILDASWRLFLAHGVEAVTIDTIAAEAGVSRGTIYSYFSDKHAIFQEGVRREMIKIEAAQAIDPTSFKDVSLEDTLIAFGVGIMEFLTSDSAVDFYNSLSGELRRNSELAHLFYDTGPGRTRANLAAILSAAAATNKLEIDDPEDAAEILFGMWQGFTNFQLSLGIEPQKIRESIAIRVQQGVHRFLKAYCSDSSK